MTQHWTADTIGQVLTLTFANAPRNMLTFDAVGELADHLDAASTRSDITVVVLKSSTPGYFAAHADLADLDSVVTGDPSRGRVWYSALSLLRTMPQPVIAAIDGSIGGGGLELAMGCSLRWASTPSTFYMPETPLGIVPGAGGIRRLVELVGLGPAAELILTGDPITAETALTFGLLGRVIPATGFDEIVDTAAQRLARRPISALSSAKRLLLDSIDKSAKEALRDESAEFARLMHTQESALLRRDRLDLYSRDAEFNPGSGD